MNNNLSYEVLIMDPKAQIFSSSPSIIPRSKIKLLHGEPKTTEIFLKVKYDDMLHYWQIHNDIQVIRHQKINRADNPCEISPDYNFGHCVEESIMRMIGCQLPWRRVNIDDLPICDNATMLARYDYFYWSAVDYGKNHLLKLTKCLMPCSFLEFKVLYFNHFHFLPKVFNNI